MRRIALGALRPLAPIQRPPSDANVRPLGPLPAGRWKNRIAPPGVIRPTRSPSNRLNQTAPSGPAVRSYGVPTPAGTGYSFSVPSVRIAPILRPWTSANQRRSSPPLTMPPSFLIDAPPGAGNGNELTEPVVVMRPIEFVPAAVNHRAPSGPTAMSAGRAPGTS